MALLESISISLGTEMPDFKLEDPFGKSFESSVLLNVWSIIAGKNNFGSIPDNSAISFADETNVVK